METIEIGAVELDAGRPTGREFQRFVRPVVVRELSDFCRRLTTIRQADVDAAGPFSVVFREFEEWVGAEAFVFASWGAYDLGQFRADCRRHGFELPEAFENHLNVKQQFARAFGVRPCGMAQALRHAGLPLTGTHHRGLDDARNIAALALAAGLA